METGFLEILARLHDNGAQFVIVGEVAAAFACVTCYSPDRDVAGTYGVRLTFHSAASRDEARTNCEGPGLVLGGASTLEITKDSSSYSMILHAGCRVPVERKGFVLETNGYEQCRLVPGSLAEAAGLGARRYSVKADLASGELLILNTSLGERGEGRCFVDDGRMTREGSGLNEPKLWYFEGTGKVLDERYEGTFSPSGYIEERKDGTLFVQGFGCTLPGPTAPGEKAAIPEGSCRTGVFAEYGAPELVPLTYSFNEREFSMSGEQHGVDRNYTFEIQSTSVRPDDWDARHD